MGQVRCPACGYCIQLETRPVSANSQADMLPGGSWPEQSANPFGGDGTMPQHPSQASQSELMARSGSSSPPDGLGQPEAAAAEDRREAESRALQQKHASERRDEEERGLSASQKRREEARRTTEHKHLKLRHAREHGREVVRRLPARHTAHQSRHHEHRR